MLRRHICVCFLLLFVASISLHAQPLLSVFDVDASGFPSIKAKFIALDRNGIQVQGLAPGEFSVVEDGTPRTVVSVTCPPPTQPEPLTVGVMVDTYRYIDLAAAGTRRILDWLRMPPGELGITTMDKGVFIIQDLTMSRKKATDATARLISSPGTHLQQIFYDTEAGGVRFVSGRPNRKALVLITDLHCPLFDLDTNRLWKDAARERISVYSILLHANDYQGLFNRLGSKTGGKVFERVTTVEQIERIMDEITMEQRYEPCQIEWLSEARCDASRRSTISIPKLALQTSVEYTAPARSVPKLQVSPAGISFGTVEPGRFSDTTFVITASNHAVTISSMTTNNPAFQIVLGGAPPTFTLEPGESRTVTLRFVPIDSTYLMATVVIESDACLASPFIAAGGSTKRAWMRPALRLMYPNGGERLIAGSRALLTWDGVLPSDTVALEYSTDGGTTWDLISQRATGLSYLWDVPVTPSERCLARVRRASGGSSAAVILKNSTPLFSSRFSADGTRIATRGSVEIKLWNAITGAKVTIIGPNDPSSPSGEPSGRVDFSPDSKSILAAWADVALLRSSFGSIALLQTFRSRSSPVTTAIFNPEGDRVLIHGADSGERVFNVETGAIVSSIPNAGVCSAFSPDGNLIASFIESTKVAIWESATGKILRVLTGHTAGPGFSRNTLAFSPDGLRVVSAGDDGTVRVHDVVAGIELLKIDVGRSIRHAVFSPDRSRLLTTTFDGSTSMYDALSGQRMYTVSGYTSLESGNDVTDRTFSPDGKLFLTAAPKPEQHATVFDATSGQELLRLIGHTNTVTSAVFSADGTRIATTSMDKTAIIHDVSNLVPQSDISDSLWAIIAPKLEVRVTEIDMGQSLVMRNKDSLVGAVLCNIGSSDLHVLGVDVGSGDTDDFMIMSGAGDFVLAPGECRDIVMTFSPMSVGHRHARFTVRTSTDTLVEAIHVFGIGEMQQLEVVTRSIDFGGVNVGGRKDSSISLLLKNIGTTPFTITGTFPLGPDTSQFAVVSGGGRFVLAPAETRSMVLRFAPTAVGKTSGRVAFHYDGAGSPATAALFGEGVGAELVATADSLGFDPMFCESSRDSIVDIYNGGNADLHISNASIGGATPGAYSIEWLLPSPPPITLTRGAHASARIRLTQGSTGVTAASLVLATNAVNAASGTFTIPLSGAKDSVWFTLSDTIVAFEDIPAGAQPAASIVLTNTGSIPLTWKAPVTIGPITIESISPQTTMPNGGTSTILFRYGGGNEGESFKGSYPFDAGYCGIVQNVGLSASVHADASAALELPDISAAPGDIVEIPVRLADARFVAHSGATGFETVLRFNASLLVPIPPTPMGTIKDGERIIPLLLPSTPQDRENLLVLRFRAALGNDTVTSLTLEGSRSVGGPVTMTQHAGRFTLTGVCNQGGARLFTIGESILLRVTPSQTGTSSTVEYHAVEAGHTRLVVADLLGREVAVLFDGDVVPGTYVLDFDTSQLGAGGYFCMLQTPTQRVVTRWMVR